MSPQSAARIPMVLLLAISLVIPVMASAEARPRDRLVTKSYDGARANCNSSSPSISRNGRYVAFYSCATNILRRNRNPHEDVYRRDLRTGKTVRVSVNNRGIEGNDDSRLLDMSADGNIVVFLSYATNLPGQGRSPLMYWRNVERGRTKKVSTGGVEATISPDGRYILISAGRKTYLHDRRSGRTKVVAYGAYDSDIAAEARFIVFTKIHRRSSIRQVYRKNLRNGNKVLVSRSNRGKIADEHSSVPAISPNGRFVVFETAAKNLNRRDDEHDDDIYLRDLRRRKTFKVSKIGRSMQSRNPSISDNGRRVAFHGSGPDDGSRVYLSKYRRQVTVMLTDTSAYQGELSGNGEFVAYQMAIGDYSIYRHGSIR